MNNVYTGQKNNQIFKNGNWQKIYILTLNQLCLIWIASYTAINYYAFQVTSPNKVYNYSGKATNLYLLIFPIGNLLLSGTVYFPISPAAPSPPPILSKRFIINHTNAKLTNSLAELF